MNGTCDYALKGKVKLNRVHGRQKYGKNKTLSIDPKSLYILDCRHFSYYTFGYSFV